MKVGVKDLDAAIELKNNGMEIEVRDNNGTFLGDLVVTKSGLVWCNGKTKRENGKKIPWATFIAAAQAGAIVVPKPVKAAKAAKVAKAPAKAAGKGAVAP